MFLVPAFTRLAKSRFSLERCAQFDCLCDSSLRHDRKRKLLVCYMFSPRGVPPLFRLCLEHREVPLVIGVIKMKHFCKMKTTAAYILMYMLPDEKECH